MDLRKDLLPKFQQKFVTYKKCLINFTQFIQNNENC